MTLISSWVPVGHVLMLQALQIGAVYDMLGDAHSAVEWFERLNMHLPQDPGVLARLGALHARSVGCHWLTLS